MPYERFHEAAEALEYDIDLLGRRFGASFEHVCQRLVTLQRPGAKGVPFFLVHLDCAGNVLRRLDAGGFRFARFGGLCPRWGVHRAFQSQGENRLDLVEMPDGARFLTIARALSRPGAGHALPGQQLVVAIGCPLSTRTAWSTARASTLSGLRGLFLSGSTAASATVPTARRAPSRHPAAA